MIEILFLVIVEFYFIPVLHIIKTNVSINQFAIINFILLMLSSYLAIWIYLLLILIKLCKIFGTKVELYVFSDYLFFCRTKNLLALNILNFFLANF
jgi:hypothetical protein